MKRIASFILIAVLLVSAAWAEAPEVRAVSGNRLGFELLAELSDGSANQIVSPLSLAYALAMAAQGAEGETRDQLLAALELENAADLAEWNAPLMEAGLRIANGAFLTGLIAPEADYVAALRDAFGAEWFAPDGDVAERVNAWVAEHTDGMIEKIIDGGLSQDTALVLVNAIAMDAQWEKVFRPWKTEETTFHTPDGDVTVQMMRDNGRFLDYGERDGVQMIKLDYADSSLALYLALPEQGGLDALLEVLRDEGMEFFQFEEEQPCVNLGLPKLDISADNALKDALAALGVEAAFTRDADFSGISKEADLEIGEVLQKVRLIFDEEGTRAAAATAAMMEFAALPVPMREMIFDRPFVAVIADQESGAVCFAAAICDPTAS